MAEVTILNITSVNTALVTLLSPQEYFFTPLNNAKITKVNVSLALPIVYQEHHHVRAYIMDVNENVVASSNVVELALSDVVLPYEFLFDGTVLLAKGGFYNVCIAGQYSVYDSQETTLLWCTDNPNTGAGVRDLNGVSPQLYAYYPGKDLAIEILGEADPTPGTALKSEPEDEAVVSVADGVLLKWQYTDGQTKVRIKVIMGDYPDGEYTTAIINRSTPVTQWDLTSSLVTWVAAGYTKFWWDVEAGNGYGYTPSAEGYWSFQTLGKAINPDPSDAEANVVNNKATISWENEGGATSYDIYFGMAGYELVLLAEQQAVNSWKSPLVKLHIKNYDTSLISGYRSPRPGDVLTDGTNSYTVNYVDVGEIHNTNRYAKLNAYRTSGPGGLVEGDVLTNGMSPNAENPQAVSVTLSAESFSVSDVEEPYYPSNTQVQWRVDARDD